MALTFSKFNTFAEVKAHYESIKPLVSRCHPRGQDIRPIGDRARKHERIVRVSPNCYALSDGYHFGDPVFPTYTYGTPDYVGAIKPADMVKYAPIVWRIRQDGVEEVTLRNGWGQGQHNMRYSFLYRHTPRGMWFRNRNGKHFIAAEGTEYYLAKQRTTPRLVYDNIMDADSDHFWVRGLKDWIRLQDDNSALTFANVNGRWILANGGKELPKPPKVLVNKSAKKRYEPQIKAFKEWAFTMAPMLPIEDYNYVTDIYTQVRQWIDALEGRKNNFWGNPLDQLDVKIKRQIICDADHPMYLPMAVYMLRSVETHRAETEEDAHRVKQRANRWINNTMGFNKKG